MRTWRCWQVEQLGGIVSPCGVVAAWWRCMPAHARQERGGRCLLCSHAGVVNGLLTCAARHATPADAQALQAEAMGLRCET